MSEVEVLGRLGPDGPAVFVLYTGGTFGMAPGPDGSLVPVDLRELGAHLPVIRQLPVALTVASFPDPLDIADAIIDHAPGHAGVVVLHGPTRWPTRRPRSVSCSRASTSRSC
jgi:L-asparaginase